MIYTCFSWIPLPCLGPKIQSMDSSSLAGDGLESFFLDPLLQTSPFIYSHGPASMEASPHIMESVHAHAASATYGSDHAVGDMMMENHPAEVSSVNSSSSSSSISISINSSRRTRRTHRRAHSETLFRIPDMFTSEEEVGNLHGHSNSGEVLIGSDGTGEDLLSSYMAMEANSTCLPSKGPEASGNRNHVAALPLSMARSDDSNMYPSKARPPRHHHSMSMDGSFNMPTEDLFIMSDLDVLETKMSLSELSLIDPRRARRILANRQSAARSKERKVRYTAELEERVRTLQKETDSLSAHLSRLQKDSGGLSIENSELKLRLHAMEQQAHLRDALNETLKEEIRWLKSSTMVRMNDGKNGHPF